MTPTAAFWLLALLLAAGTLACLLPTLRRTDDAGAHGALAGVGARGGSTLSLLREQLAATERDRAAGRIDAATAERLQAEISRRLLEEHAPSPAAWRADPARGTAWMVMAGIPLFAVSLYLAVGTPAALSQPPRVAAGPQPTMTQVESMVSQMMQALEARAQRGETRPEDGPAWAMAGRTLASLQRFKEADQAFARALALTPNDANLLADRADILSLLQGQNPEGEPMRLIERALRIDPDQPKALALAGSVAFKRGDMTTAITHWRRAIANLPPESEFARGLTQSLQEAMASQTPRATSTSPRIAPDKSPLTAAAGSIRGRVSLTPALRAQAQPNDTVFIVARAEQGPRMPLAIVRLRVADLPAEFTLDDSSAMSPQLRLSSYPDLVVSARISRSGQALPESGDLVGTPVHTRIGQRGVELRIDRVQP
jgi:cytochrome c-type biogenesis protein CcmH